MEGMEDDLPSPRTLRAAAERLAQYTSEQPDTGPTVQGQGFADVFSEVGSHFLRPGPASASCPGHCCFSCIAGPRLQSVATVRQLRYSPFGCL